MAYLEIENLVKSLGEGAAKVSVLNGVNMCVEKGEICTVLGQSGSGKSTLLNVIGGLDGAGGGKIAVDGADIAGKNSAQLAEYRREYPGFVFLSQW